MSRWGEDMDRENLRLPEHIAIILDGNGRWAKAKGMPRSYGHVVGCDNLEKMCTYINEIGVKYLTVYAFSTENWKRPASEVNYLMALFTNKVYGEIKAISSLGVQVRLLGNRSALPEAALKALDRTREETKNNDKLILQLAINYGGHDEIVRAVNSLIKDGIKEVSAELIRSRFDNPDIPPVDFIVRSAGEERLSNFLLFDSAYSELGFYDKLWPDWDEDMIKTVKQDFLKRTRRFGGLT